MNFVWDSVIGRDGEIQTDQEIPIQFCNKKYHLEKNQQKKYIQKKYYIQKKFLKTKPNKTKSNK